MVTAVCHVHYVHVIARTEKADASDVHTTDITQTYARFTTVVVIKA